MYSRFYLDTLVCGSFPVGLAEYTNTRVYSFGHAAAVETKR